MRADGCGCQLQDVGAHRRDSSVEHPSVERELWKRAFWVLVSFDRTASAALGRACAIQYDECVSLFPLFLVLLVLCMLTGGV